jgi:capsular polysaccharide biosynthesis protein
LVAPHYGHFITASLSRLWHAFRRPSPDLRILVHSYNPLSENLERPYVAAILKGLGLSPSDFVQFDEPTVVSRLIVPGPSFDEQHRGHPVFGEMCRAIGDAVAGPGPTIDKPVYLSRLKLGGGVFSRMREEAAFAAALEEGGVDIVSPETLPFAEQVALHARRRFVIGTGSALHTSIFSRPPGWIVGLAPDGTVNTNLMLMDRLRGGSVVYVTQPGAKAVKGDAQVALVGTFRGERGLPLRKGERSVSEPLKGGAWIEYDLPDPAGFARDIVDFLRMQGAPLRSPASLAA